MCQAPSQVHLKKCDLEGRHCGPLCLPLFRKESFPCLFFHIPFAISLPFPPSFHPLCDLPCLHPHFQLFQVSLVRKSVLFFSFPEQKIERGVLISDCHSFSHPSARAECSFQKPKRWSCCKRRKAGTLAGPPRQASHTHHHQHIHAETARRGCRSQRLCFQNINIAPAFLPNEK